MYVCGVNAPSFLITFGQVVSIDLASRLISWGLISTILRGFRNLRCVNEADYAAILAFVYERRIDNLGI